MSENTENPNDDDRARGILSTTDRRWVKGKKKYKHAPTESNRKRIVHERIRNALYDFRLLVTYPEKVDWERFDVSTPPSGFDLQLQSKSLYEWAAEYAIAFMLINDVRGHIVRNDNNTTEGLHHEALMRILTPRLESAVDLALKAVRDPNWREHPEPKLEYETEIDIFVSTTMYNRHGPKALARDVIDGEIDRGDLFEMVEQDQISAATAEEALERSEAGEHTNSDDDNGSEKSESDLN